MIATQQIDTFDPQQMREALLTLMAEALIDKLTHEVANLRRLKYAVTSEKFCAGMSAEQKSLLEETLDSDIAQLTAELEQAAGDRPDEKDKKARQSPKREPLPPHRERLVLPPCLSSFAG